MKIISLIFLIFTLFIGGCSADQQQGNNVITPQQVTFEKVVLEANFQGKMGQTIYVPIYSHIYYENSERSFGLAATLSIRNTDLTKSMIVTAVNYYDSGGNLLRNYLDQPIQLDRLASADFVVNRTDNRGGAGANFIVEWLSRETISEPIVEAVMISGVGNQGISFISQGRVIKKYP
jgi:uncharacterized protein YcfL